MDQQTGPLRLVDVVLGSLDGLPIRFGPRLWADIWASSPAGQLQGGELTIPPGVILRVEARLESETDHAERVAQARYGSGEPGVSDHRVVLRPEEGAEREDGDMGAEQASAPVEAPRTSPAGEAPQSASGGPHGGADGAAAERGG